MKAVVVVLGRPQRRAQPADYLVARHRGGENPRHIGAGHLAGGFFFTPTLFRDVKNDMRIAQEEIFGPVTAAIPFHDEEELVALANGTKYGLAAGMWTKDVTKAHRIARRLKAGTVWINCYRRIHWMSPFGGYKLSGYGRENGTEVMHLYTQVKSVWVDLSEKYADPYAN